MPNVFPIVGWQQNFVHNHWDTTERGGSDLFAPFGTSVVSMSSGRVIDASNDSTGGINVSIFDAQTGLTFYYAHLDDRFTNAALVNTGETVTMGQQLGGVGDSGNARGVGAHLHIGIGFGIQTGTGPGGGCGINFDAVKLLQDTLNNGGSSPNGFPHRRIGWHVANTDGDGLFLRDAPGADSSIIRLMPEGNPIEILDRAWRPVLDPTDGAIGWAAEQFLVQEGQRFRVANTDGAGLYLRTEPTTDGAPVKLLADGTLLESRGRAWRRIVDLTGGQEGWAAEQFLSKS